MILIKNTQRKIPVNTTQLKKDAQKLLTILGYIDFDLGIWLTTDQTIRKYNKQYRGKDKPTDILSFAYWPDLKAGEKIKPDSPEDKNLGDIIMSPAYIKKDLPRWDMGFNQRMRVLLVHGICHLLGYDHIKDVDYAVMHRKEQFLLRKLSDQ